MHKLLMTSALAVPLLALPAFAQDAPPPAETEAPQATPMPEEGMTDDTMQQDDTTVVIEPAEGDDPAMAQDPMDETSPDMAQDPMDETSPDMAQDPMDETSPDMAQEPIEGDTVIVEEPVEGTDPAMAGTADPVMTEQTPSELRAEWVTGTTVTSPQGENIGPIQDLIIDPEQGQITAAIIGVGGFLGIGAKSMAVDWNELQVDADGRAISLDLTREEAEAAPEYAFRERDPGPDAMGDPMGGGMGGGGMGGGGMDPAAPPPN